MRSRAVVFVMGLALLLPAVTYASGRESPSPKSTRQVVDQMHHINQMEIKAGRLAEKKSHNERVREYGARLVRDHTALDHKLFGFAKSEHIAVGPVVPTTDAEKKAAAEDKATMAKLEKATGVAFDRMFLSTMVTDHEHAIALLNHAKKTTHNDKLKDLLSKTIPVLEQHLKIARDLAGFAPTG